MSDAKTVDAIVPDAPPVEIKSAVPTEPPPEIPRAYAKYLSLRDWKAVDCKKSPNIEIIKHLTDAIVHDLKMIYPLSASKITVTIAPAGAMQLIMLMRILSLSAATIGFSNMDILIAHMKTHFPVSSLEYNAWSWFDNVCMNPTEALPGYIATFLGVGGPVCDYVSTVITEDMRATNVASIGIAKMSVNDNVAQCAVQEVIDFMKFRMIKISEALIEVEGKVAIKFTAGDISGILRSTWRGGNINRQFYSDLCEFGESFTGIKKYCKSIEDASKPKRVRKPKSDE